jgi:tetratricopeptide (TPR) repeat protein
LSRSAASPLAQTSPLAAAGRWLFPALLIATVLAYLPVLRAGFIWDDDAHLTAPGLRSFAGLWRIWSEPGATQQYYPFLHSVFWLEHRLWGDHALGYHLANLAFHFTAAWLFFRLLRRLAVPGAGLAAFLFALHPVQVESVAWISEQKNTLSLVFYLGAALAYLRFDSAGESGRPRPLRPYALASALFALALLTKSVTATLPAALLVVLWWQRETLSWRRDVRPLAPWFALGVLAGLFTAGLERNLIGAEGLAYDLSFLQRALLAGRVLWFYLGKLLWPADLAFVYPRWSIDPASFWSWLPLLAVLGLAGWFYSPRLRSRGRAPLAALLLFAGSLFPVLGFFNVYPFVYSFVADHFQYLASLAIFAAVAAALTRLGRPSQVFGAVLLVILGTLTWRQSHDYLNAETLYRATLVRNPAAWMAHNNLGRELLRDPARRAEAIACFERALALRPDYLEALNNLGLTLAQSGRPREALPYLESAVRLNSASYQAHNNLGIALASAGRAADAVAVFRRAVRLNPGLPNLHENLGKALRLAGREPEARAAFEAATRLRQAAPSP